MNTLIAIAVGALTSTVVLVAGVNVAQNNDAKPVSNEKLYSYADQ
ncbi:hypothetical protein GCM10022237_07920 [Nocardioides ginsengisoli]|jgi:hypothetical protein|uniref:DUF2613 family protein n=1 Tax=Nocardioides ginsengisoli TaxID=363868 RepID=A0ABW3W041_9ACTN